MENTIVSDANNSIAYAIYMIMGSYFKKAVCKSSLKEQQLKVIYAEQKRENQFKIEERCENYIENRIVPEVPSEIFEDMVEVKMKSLNNKVIVTFIGFDWQLSLSGENTGKGYMLEHHFTSNIDN